MIVGRREQKLFFVAIFFLFLFLICPKKIYAQCTTCGFYSGGPTQLEGDWGGGDTSLSGGWSMYQAFTPSTSGTVNGVSIKVNTWQEFNSTECKITTDTGNPPVDVSSASSIASVGRVLEQWLCLSFSSPVNLTAGLTYRLYCRKPPGDWGDTRWLRINGGSRTYAICEQYVVPTATPVPTSTPSPTPVFTPTPTPTPTPCSSYSTIWSFRYQQVVNPWWQTKDLDVHSQGTMVDLIPVCAPVPPGRYLSLKGDGGMPGVVSWNGADPSLGTGSLSETNWQAKSAYNGSEMKFDYLKNRLNVNTDNVLPGSGSVRDIPAVSGTYFLDLGAIELNGGAVPSGRKVIILINGDVTVRGDVTVSVGGFFALIAKGRISFQRDVRNGQGFYLAEGILEVNKKDSGADVQFRGEGSFVGWGGVSLRRDLGGGPNNCSPAEYFVSRPDLYVNAPLEFLFTPSVFQEVAP